MIQQEELEVDKFNDSSEIDVEPIRMYVGEFTQNGEVNIQFLETLKSIDQQEFLNLTIISNDTFFTLDYQTFVEGGQVGYENVPQLLDWKVANFGSLNMTIKLNLSNPIMVSTGDKKDQLRISFEQPYLFRSALDGRVLEENYTIATEVP